MPLRHNGVGTSRTPEIPTPHLQYSKEVLGKSKGVPPMLHINISEIGEGSSRVGSPSGEKGMDPYSGVLKWH